jgi:hypothetical protein
VYSNVIAVTDGKYTPLVHLTYIGILPFANLDAPSSTRFTDLGRERNGGREREREKERETAREIESERESERTREKKPSSS